MNARCAAQTHTIVSLFLYYFDSVARARYRCACEDDVRHISERGVEQDGGKIGGKGFVAEIGADVDDGRRSYALMYRGESRHGRDRWKRKRTGQLESVASQTRMDEKALIVFDSRCRDVPGAGEQLRSQLEMLL